MLLTDTIAGLLAAIDAGDDSALLPLSDVMEENGDPRAAGLRRIGDRRPEGNPWIDGILDRPSGAIPEGPTSWLWRRTRPHRGRIGNPERLAPRLFASLPHPAANYVTQIGRDRVRPYPTRSAAFLALAAALTESTR